MDVNLDGSKLAFTNKILSSDAFAAQIIDRIKKRTPTSAIRMSDGERGFIVASQTGRISTFMKNDKWLKEYGLLGSNHIEVGNSLLEAGKCADYLACTISGVFREVYNTHKFFPNRKQFVDQFYPKLWNATGRTKDVLNAGSVLVLHRKPQMIVDGLIRKYGLEKGCDGMVLDSWKDQACLLDEVGKHDAEIVLVSGGPSGKKFCVDLAQQTGKVVLDVGCALGNVWA